MFKKLLIFCIMILLVFSISIQTTEAGWFEDLIDWFKDVFGLSQEEAEAKVGDILEDLNSGGIIGMEIQEFNINLDKTNLKKMEFDDIDFSTILTKKKDKIKQDIILKNKLSIQKEVNYSQKIKIDYDKIRWNGTYYYLSNKPVVMTSWQGTGGLVVPLIFMDDIFYKTINYKDIALQGGYALAYKEDEDYFIEFRIDDYLLEPFETRIIDPTYTNATGGFAIGIAGDWRGLTVSDTGEILELMNYDADDMYHYDEEGNSLWQTSVNEYGATKALGVAHDGTRNATWVLDDGFEFIFKLNNDYTNATGGCDFTYITSTPRDFTMDSRDDSFWIIDDTAKVVHHIDNDCSNLSGNFYYGASGVISGYSIGFDDTDNSFWISNLDFGGDGNINHFDTNGANTTGSFSTAGLAGGSGDIRGMAFDPSDNGIWTLDNTNLFVYHFDAPPPANNAPNNPTGVSFNSTVTEQTNYTNETLNANFLCDDDDTSDTLTYDLYFYVNGIYNFSVTSVSCSDPEYVTYVFDSANTTRGDNWSFSVNVTDDTPESSATVFSNNITIENIIPNVPVPLLNSTLVAQTNKSTENLACNFLCNDSDIGDSLTYDIYWYNNGTFNLSFVSQSCSNPSYNSPILNSSNTTVSELWSCAININDSVSSTSFIFSNNVTILPSITTPTINLNSTNDAQTNLTNESLTCNFNCETSLSGDTLTYSLDFLENNVTPVYSERDVTCSNDWYSIELFNENTTSHLDYTCRVNITSSLDSYTTDYYYSNNFTIENYKPTNIQIVAPSPANRTYTSNLTNTFNCSAEDLDNDTLYYEYYMDTVNPPTLTLLANSTGSTTNTSVDGNYWWLCIALDAYDGYSLYSGGYLVIDNSTIKNVTYYRPTPVYETSSYQYEVNMTINRLTTSSATASFTYNNIGYTPTRTTLFDGDNYTVYNWKQTLSTPIKSSTDIIWNFTLTLNNGTTNYESSSLTQTINPISFGLCNDTLNTTYVNYTFKDEKNDSLLNAKITSSTFIYSIDENKALNKTLSFSNTTENPSYAFCFEPINKTVFMNIDIDYENDGAPQRNYINTSGLYSNVTNNHILYLLSTSSGIYSTFQVVTPVNQVIEDVYVTVERLISGTYEFIESGETDSAGAVTFFVNPDYLYRFTFEKSGYDTQVLSINPTQSTYTVTMGEEATADIYDYSLGIRYDISPYQDILNNQTDYNFTFNISSSYWSLTSSGFTLTNGSGIFLGASSCTSGTGCVSSTTVNTQNHTSIIMNYYWEILNEGDYYFMNSSKTWKVFESGRRTSTVTMFMEDIEKMGNGFGDFTKAMISFFIILFAIGIMSYYSGIYSPLAILGEIFFLVFLLDQVNFIPEVVNAVPHFITIMIGLLFMGYGIYEYTKGGL